MKENKRTLKQNKEFWRLANIVGEECARDVVQAVSGQRSTRKLTKEQMMKVIDKLKIAVGEAPPPVYNPKIERLAPPWQLKKIEELARKLKMNEQALHSFCKRQCGKERPATTREANKVIEGLKEMLRRGWQSNYPGDTA